MEWLAPLDKQEIQDLPDSLELQEQLDHRVNRELQERLDPRDLVDLRDLLDRLVLWEEWVNLDQPDHREFLALLETPVTGDS